MDTTAIIDAIRTVRQLCTKDNSGDTLYLRNINLLMKNDGVNSLHMLLEPSELSIVLCDAMNFLNEISAISGTTSDISNSFSHLASLLWLRLSTVE